MNEMAQAKPLWNETMNFSQWMMGLETLASSQAQSGAPTSQHIHIRGHENFRHLARRLPGRLLLPRIRRYCQANCAVPSLAQSTEYGNWDTSSLLCYGDLTKTAKAPPSPVLAARSKARTTTVKNQKEM